MLRITRHAEIMPLKSLNDDHFSTDSLDSLDQQIFFVILRSSESVS